MSNTATRSNRSSSTLPPPPSSNPGLLRAYVNASERVREALADQDRILASIRAADHREAVRWVTIERNDR